MGVIKVYSAFVVASIRCMACKLLLVALLRSQLEPCNCWCDVDPSQHFATCVGITASNGGDVAMLLVRVALWLLMLLPWCCLKLGVAFPQFQGAACQISIDGVALLGFCHRMKIKFSRNSMSNQTCSVPFMRSENLFFEKV